MALETDKFVYFHIPKTGGTWIRNAIKKSGIICKEVGDTHITVRRILHDYDYAHILRDKHVIVSIRNPYSWYQSYWSFKMKVGWSMNNPFDNLCASNDFNRFMINVYDNCSEYYNHIIDSFLIDEYVNCVILYESLVTDFTRAMRDIYGFDCSFSDSRVNVSDMSGLRSYDMARYNDYTYGLVSKMNGHIIDKYYA